MGQLRLEAKNPLTGREASNCRCGVLLWDHIAKCFLDASSVVELAVIHVDLTGTAQHCMTALNQRKALMSFSWCYLMVNAK